MKVAAEDRDTTETYTVTVTRRPPLPPLPTPTRDALVSNTGKGLESPQPTNIAAQSFETGTHAGEYTISEVGVRLGNAEASSDVRVRIRENSSSDRPGDLVAELTKPETVTGHAVNWFSAPVGTRLDGDGTTYWITVNEASSTRAPFRYTTSPDEDGGAADGWSIGNSYLSKSSPGDSWSTRSSSSVSLAIRGDEVSDTTPPTLESAVVPASGGEVVLTFDEALNISATDLPAASAFTVEADGDVTVTGVTADMHDTLMLSLSRPIVAGETVTVSYAVPGTGKVIEDAVGNDAAAITDYAVTNNSTVTADALSDATLSALALADSDDNAVELTPAFAADVPVYRARVANAVEAVTVTATKNEARAADPVFLDGTDATLTDADGVAAGFQFALAEGDNTIRVRVTAADLVTTETYTVVVTRARPTLPPLPPLPTPTGNALVSNLNQGNVDNHDTFSVAQPFTTGSAARLSGVDIVSADAEGDGFSAKVCTTDASGDPTNSCTTLTAPSSFAAGTLRFTAPAGTVLTASTTYAVVVNRTVQGGNVSVNYGGTYANGEDAGKADGWSIANAFRVRINNAWVVHTFGGGKALRMAISGVIADTTAPSLSSAAVPAPGDKLELTFDGDLDISATDLPPASAFTVEADGAVTVTGVTADEHDVLMLSLSRTIYADETVTVSYTKPDPGKVIEDALGNETESFTDFEVTNGSTVPVPGPAACPTYANWCAKLTVGVSPNFVLYGWKGSYGSIDDDDIEYGGTTWHLTHIQYAGDMMSVKLNAFIDRGTVFNLGGSEFVADETSEQSSAGVYGWTLPAGFGWLVGQEVRVSANLPPVLVSATAEDNELVLTYAENLNANSVPAVGDYEVKVDGGAAANPSSVSITGKKVTLTLASAVTSGQAVTLTYTVPASNPVQDPSGLKAAALTDEGVETADTTPPAPESGEVVEAGDSVLLNFDEDLDISATDLPPASAFTVEADGDAVAVSTVATAHGESQIRLLLSTAIGAGQKVTVSYTKPPSGKVIEDAAGNETASFEDFEVTNNSTEDTTPPALTDGSEVTATGLGLLLSFDEDLDLTSGDPPPVSAFTVKADGVEVTVDSVAFNPNLSNRTLLQSLSTAIGAGQTVTVSYTKPSSGKVIADAAGNETEDFTDEPVTNNSTVDTTPPAPESAEVSGTGRTLTLTFDEDLDITATDVPPASAFTVEADGVAVGVDTVIAGVGVRQLFFELSTVIGADQEVTVSYTKPDSGKVIEDAAGNETASFDTKDFDPTDFTMTNNSTVDTTPPAPESGEVSGTGRTLTLTFDEDLDITATDVPPASAFTVEADGVAVGVDTVIAGVGVRQLFFELSTAIYTGQTVTVGYTKPDPGKVIEDAAGNETESFDTKDFDPKDFTMTNNSTVDDPGNATGKPTLSGTAEAGQTLTVSTSGISDPDGKTKAEGGDAGYAYTYRWFRVDSDGVSNRTEISGATAASYTLTADDVGRKIIVEVAFVDDTDVREGPLASDPHPASGTVTATDPSVPAVVTGIAFTNEPEDGVYNPGDVIEVTVTFDKAVDVTGSPRLKIVPYASAAVYAELESSAGTARTLVFRHAVTGPRDGRLFISGNGAVLVNANTLELNGGTIRNPGTTTDANLDHALVAGLEVNTRLVEDIFISSTPRVPAADTGGVKVFGPGDTVEFTVRFSDTVTVSGTPTLGIDTSATDITANYSRGGETKELHFEATMPARFSDRQNIGVADNDVAPNGLQRNGATLTDSGGRAVNVSHVEFERTAVLDGLAPQLLATPEGATVNRKKLELSYLYNTGTTQTDYLDPGSEPEPTDFVVSVGGTAVTVESVAIPDLNTVRLTLTSAVKEGTTVTVSYTPGTNPIQDAGGNDAAAFTGRAVRIDTPEAVKGEVRITDGYDNEYDPEDGDAEGRLEVFYGGKFGSVCDDRFDRDFDDPGTPGDTTKVPNQAAHLACRWAGYETGAMVSNAGRSAKPLKIWLDDVRCVSATDKHWRPAGSPDPTGLHHCYNAGVGLHNCKPEEDVWLACTGTRPVKSDDGAPLRASFEDVPQAHDGTTAFTLRLVLSEPVETDADAFRDDVFQVKGGSVTGAALVGGSDAQWEITVAPDGDDAVSVVLPSTTDCAAAGAVCTGDGRALSEMAAAAVAGPGQTPSPLTAKFTNGPATHDGTSRFNIDIVFSEAPAGMKNEDIRAVVQAKNARKLGMSRLNNVDDAHRNMRFDPLGNGDITISIPATTDCAAAGALCTAAGGKLETGISVTIPGPAATAPPLTASFEKVPEEHDGTSRFNLDIVFSEAPAGMKNEDIRAVVQATNAWKRGMSRLNNVNDAHRNMRFDPKGNGKITISIPATTDCAAAGALCTTAGGKLETGISVTIPGPVAISVADDSVEEAAGAVLAFAVTLDRARHDTVTVDYATENGTATAGEDYTATSGTLTFAAGETAKTVEVAVLDDLHDEGNETLVLRLSNPSGARIADGEATGTIENTDHMPQAWLARFGRTVAEQVIEAVETRMRAPRTPGAEVSLAGRRIGLGPLFGTDAAPDDGEAALAKRAREAEAEAEEGQRRLAAWLRGAAEEDERPGPETQTVTERQLLLGSSFSLTAAPGDGAPGAVSLWGRAAVSRFDGREAGLTLDGEVASGLLGADWARERSTLGLILSHSRGDGGYRGEGGSGTVSSTLTGLYPWGRHALSDRVTVWGVVGYGAGTLTLTPENDDGTPRAAIRTDMDLMMGAVGLRGVVVEAPAEGGPELSLKTDALGVRTSSEAVRGGGDAGGNLAAAEADVTRLRLGLEGRWTGLAIGTGTLEPRLEVGVRHDGGDAETGFGLDLGGGLAWSDPGTGIRAEVSGRGLLTHESAGFRQRGIAGSFGWVSIGFEV